MMLTHKGTQELETERLILRRIQAEDGAAMFENWAGDDEVTKYLTWPTHASRDTSAEIARDWAQSYEKDDFYTWGITLKAEGNVLIGTIGAIAADSNVGKIEIGYCIGRKWWHKGFMPEAVKSVMDFLFDQVGVNRIEAYHDTRNPNSGRVMQKCGMKYEGTLRQAARNNQGIGDICMYSLLREERTPD